MPSSLSTHLSRVTHYDAEGANRLVLSLSLSLYSIDFGQSWEALTADALPSTSSFSTSRALRAALARNDAAMRPRIFARR